MGRRSRSVVPRQKKMFSSGNNRDHPRRVLVDGRKALLANEASLEEEKADHASVVKTEEAAASVAAQRDVVVANIVESVLGVAHPTGRTKAKRRSPTQAIKQKKIKRRRRKTKKIK